MGFFAYTEYAYSSFAAVRCSLSYATMVLMHAIRMKLVCFDIVVMWHSYR